jgi:hypothetical protein
MNTSLTTVFVGFLGETTRTIVDHEMVRVGTILAVGVIYAGVAFAKRRQRSRIPQKMPFSDGFSARNDSGFTLSLYLFGERHQLGILKIIAPLRRKSDLLKVTCCIVDVLSVNLADGSIIASYAAA